MKSKKRFLAGLISFGLLMFFGIMLFSLRNAFSAGTIDLPKVGPSGGGTGISWPSPRFTDNNNGTITDNLTGLIWLKDANCFGQKTWYDAINAANTLKGDGTLCGLNDSSQAGTWRLPNINELDSLINYEASTGNGVADWLNSPGQGFQKVQPDNYWVSTSYAGDVNGAWAIRMTNGIHVLYEGGGGWSGNKNNPGASPGVNNQLPYVWPVKGTATDSGAIKLPKTGQTYDDPNASKEDGELKMGVAWPTSRFTFTGNVAIDNLTGLMWTKSGNPAYPNTRRTQGAAQADISTMNSNQFGGYNDWRLPNILEIKSLINWNYECQGGGGNTSAGTPSAADCSMSSLSGYYLTGEGFIDVGEATQNADPPKYAAAHWTSTDDPLDSTKAYTVSLVYAGGVIGTHGKNDASNAGWVTPRSAYYFWPVRTVITGEFNLTVSISPSNSGTVTGNGNEINCPTDCAQTGMLSNGIALNLTANPNPGYAFKGWKNCLISSGNQCTETIKSNTSIIARFISFDVNTSVSFGNVNKDSSATMDIIVKNGSNSNMQLGKTTAPSSPFSIEDDCANKNLSAGGTCTIKVKFSPESASSFIGTLKISDVKTVTLTGTGVSTTTATTTAPDISVSTYNMNGFLNTSPGSGSSQTLTIKNYGSSDLTITTGDNFTGTDTTKFDITGGTCVKDLFSRSYNPVSKDGECTIIITYTAPSIPGGPHLATLEIQTNDPDEKVVRVALIGSSRDSNNNPNIPTQPTLTYPENGATNISKLRFNWTDATDDDAETVTHKLYYSTDPGFGTDVAVIGKEIARNETSKKAVYASILGGPLGLAAFIITAVICGFAFRKKKFTGLLIVFLMFGVLIVGGLILSSCGKQSTETTTTTEVQAGKTYYWKVIADDGHGGVSESDVYTFTTSQ